MNVWMIGESSMKHQTTENKDFYSHLNMEDMTDADYAHAKIVCEDFEIKNLGEYHDLYVQGDTLLLADVFENFQNMCFEIQKLYTAKFLSAPGLIWQVALKETKVKLDLIEQTLLIRSKANNKYIKYYDKYKE